MLAVWSNFISQLASLKFIGHHKPKSTQLSAKTTSLANSAQPRVSARIVFVANSDWYLYNFRANLIRQTENAGWQVTLVCTDGPYIQTLRDCGWRVLALPLESAGASPLREAWALARLARTLRAERPDIVHLFTLKCVLYGCLAAPLVPGAKFIGALTGMGYLFTTTTLKARTLKQFVLRGLSLGLKKAKADLIFQNEADRQEFIDVQMIPEHRTHVIRGSGVDCEQFHPANRTGSPDGELRVLFCGRLIAEKGIRDYLAATNALKKAGYTFTSRIAGDTHPGNPSSLTTAEVKALAEDVRHTYLGHQDNMPGLLAETDVVVLPTYYREGTPKILLEAAAAGCLIITTTIPACEDIVDEGKNGAYVPPQSPKAIQDALSRFLNLSRTQLNNMRNHSRHIAEQRFEDSKVNQRTMELYPGYARLHQ